MGTIKKQVEEMLNIQLETFESIHDANLCSHVDFFLKTGDNKGIGFMLKNTDSVTPSFSQSTFDFKDEFKEKFDGDLIVVNYDSTNDTILSKMDLVNEFFNAKKFIIHINTLENVGLDNTEAKIFYNLCKKITPSSEYIKSFHNEMGAAIPFEGGIGFSEALVAISEQF